MAQRGRDPRLNRRRERDYYLEHQATTDRERCIRPLRTTVIERPGPIVYSRLNDFEVNERNCSEERTAEQYNYRHKWDRPRSSEEQLCETDSLLQSESLQTTVENDKFKSPFSSRPVFENPLPASSRGSAHNRHDIAEETPSITRAREMTMRTQEMLSKLTGWTPLSLQPLLNNHANMTDRPRFVNVSNSAYTKVSASSEVAQSILQNISAIAAAICPKDSGGVTHIKYKKLGKIRKSTNEDDEDRYLYGEELVSEKIENAFSGLPSDGSQRKCHNSASGDQSLILTESSVRQTNDNECDPVVANVLKSIGFNFQLSKIMQEKAKEEREENERNRILIQNASSHSKQLAVKSQNTQEVSNDDNEALVTRHLGDDLKKTLKRRDADILYDDFSNSEDEFNGAEKQKWTETRWQNVQITQSLPSHVGFPLAVPSSVSSPATPSPGHSLPAAMQPSPPSVMIPLQPTPLLLPPSLLQVNTQPVPHQQPIWPAYQIPLPTGSLPKWKPTVSQAAREVEWDQNTQEFLRKLHEPRTTELPQNQEAKVSMSRSPSSRSTSTERIKERQQKKRSASRELSSRSDEQNFAKKRCSDGVTISDHRESCDQVTAVKWLSFLKEKLNCMKKEHSQLMSIRQKSAHTKEKLKLNRHQQDELDAEINDLLQKINCRSTKGHSAFASNDEHLLDNTQQRERNSKVINTQKRYHRLNPTDQIRERGQKNYLFMHRELSVERKKWSSKVITDRKAKLIDWSPQQELKLSTESPHKKNKTEEKIEITDELEPSKEKEVKMRVNIDKKSYEDSVGNEPKKETNSRDNEKSLENRKDVQSNELRKSKIRYDYYDGGDNWCSMCSSVFSKLSEFLDHLHRADHQQETSFTNKPWTMQQVPQSKPNNKLPPISEPAAGMEFLMPVKGFFCTLCQQFSGDCDDAELHVLSEEHNAKFKQYWSDNPTYQKGYFTTTAEKMAIKKLDTDKIIIKGRVVEKALKSCITDSGSNSPVARQGKKLRKSSSEKITSHSAKSFKHTRKLSPLKSGVELNPNAVDANFLNEANDRFANLTKESAETALMFSNNTACNPLVSKESDLVHAYVDTKIQNMLGCEITNFDADEKAASKNESVLKASLQEEADVTVEESLNAEKDTVKVINNRNATMKSASTAATEQINLEIPLLPEPLAADSSEAGENNLLRNLKMQGTVFLVHHPLVPCDVTNDCTDLNAECSTSAQVTVMPKTVPNAVSETEGVMLHSGSSTRNTNAHEPATVAQSYITYLSQEPSSEVDEREDTATEQSQKSSSNEIGDRLDESQLQVPSSAEVYEREEHAICQSLKPSSRELDEREDTAREEHAICQSLKPSLKEIDERLELESAICQLQEPSTIEIYERKELAVTNPSSVEVVDIEDTAIYQLQDPAEVDEK